MKVFPPLASADSGSMPRAASPPAASNSKAAWLEGGKDMFWPSAGVRHCELMKESDPSRTDNDWSHNKLVNILVVPRISSVSASSSSLCWLTLMLAGGGWRTGDSSTALLGSQFLLLLLTISSSWSVNVIYFPYPCPHTNPFSCCCCSAVFLLLWLTVVFSLVP